MASKILVVLAFVLFLGLSGESRAAENTQDECANQIAPILGRIDSKTTGQVVAIVNKCLQNKGYVTTLAISSAGGSLTDALAAYEFFRNAPGVEKLTTVAVGEVASAAVTIFLAGTQRKITCNSYLMVHNLSLSFSKDQSFTGNKVQETRNLYDHLRMVHIATTAAATGLPHEKIAEMFNASAVIPPKEAVRLGFAHEIIGACS